jgi:hypothetical protein
MATNLPTRIQLHMTGDRPLFRPEVLRPVLEALQADPSLAADEWGLDESSPRPFDLDQTVSVARGVSSPHMLRLWRGKPVRQSTLVRLSRRPAVITELPPATPPKDWHHLFELGDPLARAFQPDIAWAHVFRTDGEPVAGEDPRRFEMDMGVTGSGPVYDEDGPGGLGMRTYIGPRLVDFFGRDRLLSTPVPVAELDWGGVRLDLVERPWEAPEADLLSAWQAAMNHLRPAEVFAEVERGEDGYVYLSRGRRFEPGERQR